MSDRIQPHISPPLTTQPTNQPTSLLSPFALLILLWCILLGFLMRSSIFLYIHPQHGKWELSYTVVYAFSGEKGRWSKNEAILAARGALLRQCFRHLHYWRTFAVTALCVQHCSLLEMSASGFMSPVLSCPPTTPPPCPSSSPPSCNRMQPSV